MPQIVPIIDTVLSPPIGLLRPVLDEDGPYGFGSHTLTTFTSTAGVLVGDPTHNVYGTFGVIVQLQGAIPPPWGYTIGYDSGGAIGAEGFEYIPRFAQAVPQHQLLTGFWQALDVVDIVRLEQMLLWPFRLVGGDRLGLYVMPAITVDLYYLCLP